VAVSDERGHDEAENALAGEQHDEDQILGAELALTRASLP
jgi:hypothetical protein